MKRIIASICMLLVVASTVCAGWKDMTPAQRTKLKKFLKAQPKSGTTFLKLAVNQGPIIGTNVVPRVRLRDPIDVMAERQVKRIALLAGIVKADSPAQKDVKLRAYIGAASTANKPLAIYDAARFGGYFARVRTLKGSGHSAVTNMVNVIVRADSYAKTNNIGYMKSGDIESAMRDK